MRLTSLFLLAIPVAPSASAVSYVKADGTIDNPIQDRRCNIPRSYSGANLEPHADLEYATFSNSTVLFGGQPGCKVRRQSNHGPEPTTLLLALAAVPLRDQCG